MKPELEKRLDELDRSIHDQMVKIAEDFMDIGLEDFNDVLDSTGGVVTVLQARHMHAILAFLGALLDSDVSTNLVRQQAGHFKEVFSEMIDDAVTQAVCQQALAECERTMQ